MQYAVFVNRPSGPPCDDVTEEQRAALYRPYSTSAGMVDLVGGVELADDRAGKTVRLKERRVLVTDGPFADTKEVFGGLILAETQSREAAVEVAAMLQSLRTSGCIELRSVADGSQNAAAKGPRYVFLVYGTAGIDATNFVGMSLTPAARIVGGAGLNSPDIATTVRLRDSKPQLSDRRVDQTSEAMAGWLLVDANDLDSAVELASQLSADHGISIEVRTVRE